MSAPNPEARTLNHNVSYQLPKWRVATKSLRSVSSNAMGKLLSKVNGQRSSTAVPTRCLLKKQVRYLARSPYSEADRGTVLTRSRPKIMVSRWNGVGKYFRINFATYVGA
jgi:hypothetical protein